MSTTKKQQRLIQAHKICAAKGCASLGLHEMEILFLERKGWFCEQCRDVLIRDGLLIQQVTATEDYDLSSQGVINIAND